MEHRRRGSSQDRRRRPAPSSLSFARDDDDGDTRSRHGERARQRHTKDHAGDRKHRQKRPHKGDDGGSDGKDDDARQGCCRVIPPPPFAVAETEEIHYAQAVRCGDTVYVSGTVAYDKRGRMVRGGIHAQAEQVFDNLDETLRAAGCRGLEDIVQLTTGLLDIDVNLKGYLAVRKRRIPFAGYASHNNGVTGFSAPGALLVVSCTAKPNRGCSSRSD